MWLWLFVVVAGAFVVVVVVVGGGSMVDPVPAGSIPAGRRPPGAEGRAEDAGFHKGRCFRHLGRGVRFRFR